MGKKSNSKAKKSAAPAKVLPQDRADISAVVDEVFKICTKVPGATPASASQEWAEYLDIYRLIDKICTLEKDIKLPKYTRKDQLQSFLSWLKENNIIMTGLEIYDTGDAGFGLRATEDITQGQKVISVPLSAMLTEETARKSYLGSFISRDPILQHMSNIALALHVLGEYVNQQSAWQPYLRFLPSTYSTTLYFTPEQMGMLKGSIALEEAVKQFRNIARQYAYFYRILQSSPEARSWPIRDYFTFEAYRWAVSTIMTRQNRIPVKGGKNQMALIPAWDMANHKEGMYSTDFDDEKMQSICFAQCNIRAGEEFTIYYGQRSNSDLFLHNGFVATDNSNDSLAIKLGVSKNDPLHDEKVALLSSLDLPSSGTFMLIPGAHPVSSGLLAFTRIFCMDKNSLEKWRGDGSKVKDLLHEDCDVGTYVQDKTWAFLHTRVALLSQAYPTTVEEDRAALPTLSNYEQMIKKLLICEKTILSDAEAYLSSRIAK
ncbi:Histone-lysine N-methyltransferase setd3 [Halocaridina rubra]|uniref:protein-histidine N-methyltransferase n=1 Tax=Halocaridina rubra TaxID=373956 RepID=A0AAN8WZ19_HALRR